MALLWVERRRHQRVHPRCSHFLTRIPGNGALMMNPALSENGNLTAQVDSAVF